MISYHLNRFTHLRTDASRARWSAATRHRAPHKPLLLLAVTDLLAQGDLNTNLIELTPDLGETFYQLRETILGARLDDELYALLRAQHSRDLLRTALIETYFAPELQPDLVEQGLVNLEAFHYSQALLAQARVQQRPTDAEHPRPAARDQGFRRAIVRAYDHRCALCGLRMLTPDGHTALEAAHIIPWSTSYDDAPRNGMALCRLCHWTFDEGLVSVSARYRVITSPQLAAQHNIPGHLPALAGRDIIAPAEKPLWPGLEALGWHRQNVFRKR